MDKKILIVLLAVAVVAVAAALLLLPGDVPEQNPDSESIPNVLDWNHWNGNLDYSGVSDSKTPISEKDMIENWKVELTADASSMNWKTAGSSICIDDKTYYWNGGDASLYCVYTATGKTVNKVSCPSNSVYNMAISYGDDKIFVPVLEKSKTVLHAFDAKSLKLLFKSEPISGGEVQGPVSYHNQSVYFGTYSGDFACIDSKTGKTNWIISGDGWYNALPAFFGNYCIVTEKGYLNGGATIYSVDERTGAIVDSIKLSKEYCTSGMTAYKGRVYVPVNVTADDKYATTEDNRGKTLRINSFIIEDDGKFNLGSKKVWTSETGLGTNSDGSPKSGGTQSTAVIWNDRLYIGGGGSTMGTDEPFTVLNISKDGTMSVAYKINSLYTKGVPILATGYADSENPEVYIYLVEYGRVLVGESMDSTKGSADIFVIKDKKGQTSPSIVFKLTPSVPQFAYQSFTISPEGYVLVRNDSTLFCYGIETSYSSEDVESAIDLVISKSNNGYVNPIEVKKVEERYSLLGDEEKSKVSNYKDFQDLYVDVTFEIDGKSHVTEVFTGSQILDVPDVGNKFVSEWKNGNEIWSISEDIVTTDLVLVPSYADSVTVSFDSKGGSSVSKISVPSGSNLGYVKDPIRDGYSFGGWYSGDTLYESQKTVVVSNITLNAKWLKNSTISFNSEGGSSASPILVTEGKEIGSLPEVSKTGFSFKGWFYNGTLYESTTIYSFDYDIALTAKWEANSSTTISVGKVTVTADMPATTEMTVAKLPEFLSSVKTIREYAGADTECYRIYLGGDGITGDMNFRLGLPVGNNYNGSEMEVYCYIVDKPMTTIKGTVTDGILYVDMNGTTNSFGADLVFGIEPGTNLSKEVKS